MTNQSTISRAIASLDKPVHDYRKRLERSRYNVSLLPNGSLCLRFLGHLCAFGITVGRVSKYAAHLPVLLRMMSEFDLASMSRDDVECVVAKMRVLTYRYIVYRFL